MLANLREKLLNVNLFHASEEPPVAIPTEINTNAGANILKHYQEEWEKLHKLNENNARKADDAAKSINQISTEINNNKENVKLLTHLISNSNLTENISNCLHAVTHLYDTTKKVEDGLLKLEQIIDEIEFQKLKSQHQYHLKRYENRKADNFEKLKTSIELEHSRKVREYETNKQQVLEERQKVFQDAFKLDLETYKNLGTIPKNNQISTKNGAILEEIELDYDESELDQFFND